MPGVRGEQKSLPLPGSEIDSIVLQNQVMIIVFAIVGEGFTPSLFGRG